MLGLVPFDFKDRQAAGTSSHQLRGGSVWEITKPAFDSRSKPEYVGCPVTTVVLLSKPTVVKRVPSENTLVLEYPAPGLHVALTITELMDALQQATGTAMTGGNRAF